MNFKEDILGILGSKEDRLEKYLSEDVLSERVAIEGMTNKGGAFDYVTLAKQYIYSSMGTKMKGLTGQERYDALKSAERSIIHGVKSTFVGNKSPTEENLMNAIKDPRIAKMLRINLKTIDRVNSRSEKAGKQQDESLKMALKGGPVLTMRYSMFLDAVKSVLKDAGWIKTFSGGSELANKGASMEGKKPIVPTGKTPNLKYVKFSADSGSIGSEGDGGELEEEVYGDEGDSAGVEHKKTKSSMDTKKASVDTDTKKSSKKKKCSVVQGTEGSEGDGGAIKKASVDTKKKCSDDTEDEEKAKKTKKAWNGVKDKKIFNY